MNKDILTCLLFIVIFPRKYVVGTVSLTCLFKGQPLICMDFRMFIPYGTACVCVCVSTLLVLDRTASSCATHRKTIEAHVDRIFFFKYEAIPVCVVVFSSCEFHEWQTRTSPTNREHVRVNKARGIIGSSESRVKRLAYCHITILGVVHPHPIHPNIQFNGVANTFNEWPRSFLYLTWGRMKRIESLLKKVYFIFIYFRRY